MKVAARTIGLNEPITIGFIDFRYDTRPEYLRKERRKKLNRLNRLFKLKYIDQILKNN